MFGLGMQEIIVGVKSFKDGMKDEEVKNEE